MAYFLAVIAYYFVFLNDKLALLEFDKLFIVKLGI